MKNPWYAEYSSDSIAQAPAWLLEQRHQEANQRAANLQAQMTQQLLQSTAMQASAPAGQPYQPQPQYPQFVRTQHPGMDWCKFFLYPLLGWLLGSWLDRRRYARTEAAAAPGRARSARVKAEYLRRYQAWERDYGQLDRAGYSCPPAPEYADVRREMEATETT